MKSFFPWTLALLPWAAGIVYGLTGPDAGSAPSPLDIISRIPKCALPCATESFLGSVCALDNIAPCLCTNVTLMDGMSGCVQTSCEWKDQLKLYYLTNDLCRPYPYKSRAVEIKLIVAVLAVITLPIVALRLVSRMKIAGRLELDDWTTLVTAVILAAIMASVIASADLGFGLHYWNVIPANAQRILKLYYAVQMLYIVVLISAKVSILALYARVFPSPRFQLLNKLVFVFLAGHGLAFLFAIMFQCTPIAGVWNRALEKKCVDLNAVGMASAILSIVEDIVILAMPIQQLLKLQLGFKKKLAVSFMFSLGSFACITSIIRLKWILQFAETPDTTWDNVDVVTWSVTEISMALICGSLPPLRTLFKKIPGFLTTIRGPTIETKETHDKNSSRVSLGHEGLVPQSISPDPSTPEPTSPGMDLVILHVSNEHEARMKPLPPPPLQPLTYEPPWRGSGSLTTPRTPRAPMTPTSVRSIRREAEADYEMDLRSVVNTKTWM